jgi:HSP20 family protein
LHKLSTLCPIDFEPRLTFRDDATLAARSVEKPESRPNFDVTRVILDITDLDGEVPTFLSRSLAMTVVRYEPWALVSRLQKDIDRLFGAPLTTAADSGAWLPPVDIHEEANQFALHVDLPGVDPKAVEITADQGVLTIRGKREDARREAREGYRRVERITGDFQRRFSLPDSADTQNIKAKFINGVLEVAIPKVAQVQPHRITVEAA